MSLALLLVLYLLGVSSVMALLVLPALRHRLFGWTQRRVGAWRTAAHGSRHAIGRRSALLRAGIFRVGHGIAAWGPRQWGVAAGLLTALLGPALLAAWLGAGRWLPGFDERAGQRIDPQVAALLQGEQLVPPAPLPPEVFATREVEAERPLLASASREWGALDADFRQRLLLAFKLMRDRHGYEMALLEGYRSPERQELLRARGPQVTRAGAFESYHQFGLAADAAFYRQGTLVISEKDPWAARGYALFGEVAESVGLHWGGRWTSIVDLGHVELRRGRTPPRPASGGL